jgi:hypothetical protein
MLARARGPLSGAKESRASVRSARREEEGGGEEEEEEEEKRRRRRKGLTPSSQRRTTNKPSDKPQHTKPRKIFNQRSRYL